MENKTYELTMITAENANLYYGTKCLFWMGDEPTTIKIEKLYGYLPFKVDTCTKKPTPFLDKAGNTWEHAAFYEEKGK